MTLVSPFCHYNRENISFQLEPAWKQQGCPITAAVTLNTLISICLNHLSLNLVTLRSVRIVNRLFFSTFFETKKNQKIGKNKRGRSVWFFRKVGDNQRSGRSIDATLMEKEVLGRDSQSWVTVFLGSPSFCVDGDGNNDLI